MGRDSEKKNAKSNGGGGDRFNGGLKNFHWQSCIPNTFSTVNIKRSGTIFGTMYDKFRCTFSRFFNFPSLPTALKINQKNHLNAVNKFILL